MVIIQLQYDRIYTLHFSGVTGALLSTESHLFNGLLAPVDEMGPMLRGIKLDGHAINLRDFQ